MASILRNLFLLTLVLAIVLAVPTVEPQSPTFQSSIGNRLSGSKTLFQKIRDSIIEKIWNVPKRSTCHTSDVKPGRLAPASFRTRYGRDVALRFKIETEDEANAFSEAAKILYLDIWDYTSKWVDVRIAKEMLPSLLTLLPSSLQYSHTPLMHDLAQAVYDTYPPSTDTESWRVRHSSVHKHHHDVFFQEYQPLSVMAPWLRYVASLNPNHVDTFSIGKSAEGRDILAIKVSAPLNEQVPDDEVNGRRTILVAGGSHAREWISTSTAAYLAYSFAMEYGHSHSASVTKILQHYDIIFIPVVNPDGYEYTWSTDRLWRKNRQATTLPFCPGIDLDRAYDFKWDGQDEVDNPCTETYAGEGPFQAVEAKVLAEWANNQTRDSNVVFTSYIDLHSYSQKVLYPYSYSCDHEPANLEDLEEAAEGLAKAFRTTSGHFYQVESACESQFSFTTTTKDEKKIKSRVESGNNGGSSLDYFYDVLRVKYAYQIKLRDTGTYGFLLPRENIIPTGRETFEAMIGLGRWFLSNRGIESHDETRHQDNTEQASPNASGLEDNFDRWQSQRPDFIFHKGHSEPQVVAGEPNEEDEWERVFDEELRRRRR